MRTHEKILSVCKEIGLEMEKGRQGTGYLCERFTLEVMNDGYWFLFLRDGIAVGGNWRTCYGTSFIKDYTDEWLVQRIRELALEEKLEKL